MTVFEAFLLGLVQGLTEFLPVSSSGHLELGKVILNIQTDDNLVFPVLVHFATVLSIIVVLRKDILDILKNLFKFEMNASTKLVLQILVSAIPVAIIGLFFKDQVDALFEGDLILVGSMLLITALILTLPTLVKKSGGRMSIGKALIIGISQAVAVLPGISRSGATISTGLALGIDREKTATFAFLMVIPPILGAAVLELKDFSASTVSSQEWLPLLVGFLAAFVSGLLACRWMIGLVKKGKLVYFSIYCLLVGITAIAFGFERAGLI